MDNYRRRKLQDKKAKLQDLAEQYRYILDDQSKSYDERLRAYNLREETLDKIWEIDLLLDKIQRGGASPKHTSLPRRILSLTRARHLARKQDKNVVSLDRGGYMLVSKNLPKRTSPKPKPKSPKQKSPHNRKSPKPKSSKRKSPKRNSPKRKSSHKRKSPKRKSSHKRESPKRKSPKRNKRTQKGGQQDVTKNDINNILKKVDRLDTVTNKILYYLAKKIGLSDNDWDNLVDKATQPIN